LGNFVKRYVVFQDEEQAIAELEEKNGADLETFPEAIQVESQQNGTAGLKSMMKDLKHSAEVKVIEEALAATKWNRKLAALRLKISCKALRYKIKQYHISPPEVPDHTRLLSSASASNA
jgi:two-component system, NtrC family, response regulator AtoC